MCSVNCLLAIIAIVFPPLPVWLKKGICSADSLINIALCVLGFIPGLIHSLYIISVTPDEPMERGYIAVPAQDYDVERQAPAARSYGTTGPAQPPSQPAPRAAPQPGPSSNGDVPPPYNEAIQGDNKLQHK